MGVGVDHALRIHRHRHVAGPEQELAGLERAFAALLEKGRPLQVAVAGAVDPAGHQRRLDEARTVDPPAGIAAPEIGRAEKAERLGHGVGAAGRAEVGGRDPAELGPGEGPLRRAALQAGQVAERSLLGRLEVRRGIGVGLAAGDPAGIGDLRRPVAQRRLVQPAHVDRPPGEAEDLAVPPLQHLETRAVKELPGARPARLQREVDHGARDAPGLGPDGAAVGEPVGEPVRDDAVVGRGGAAVEAHGRISGSASSSARAPMPTPPLGRAGAAVGFQP